MDIKKKIGIILLLVALLVGTGVAAYVAVQPINKQDSLVEVHEVDKYWLDEGYLSYELYQADLDSLIASVSDSSYLDDNIYCNIEYFSEEDLSQVLFLYDKMINSTRIEEFNGYFYQFDEYIGIGQANREEAERIAAEEAARLAEEEAEREAAEAAAQQSYSYSYDDTIQYSYDDVDETTAKEWIAQRESSGSYEAIGGGGLYWGRYQLMSSYFDGYNMDYILYTTEGHQIQEQYADNYVYNRYGSWSAAYVFWQNNGWY